MLYIFGFHANPRILDDKTVGSCPLFFPLKLTYTEGDSSPLRGVLGGIFKDVHQHLPDAPGVPHDPGIKALIYFNPELLLSAFHGNPHHLRCFPG